MNASPLVKLIRKSFGTVERWYQNTPERALDEAYQAAKAIKAIEDQHFDGQPINLRGPFKGAVSTYFQTELQKKLRTIRVRLNEYKIGAAVVDLYPRKAVPTASITRIGVNQPDGTTVDLSVEDYSAEADDLKAQVLLEKLNFIDSVLVSYSGSKLKSSSGSKPKVNSKSPRRAAVAQASQNGSGQATSKPSSGRKSSATPVIRSVQDSLYEADFTSDDIDEDPSQLSSGSFIPRSILRTANRFRKELNPDPTTEEDILQDFRTSRERTQRAVRFILLLIIVPLLTQSFFKYVVISPIVDQIRGTEKLEIIVNPEIERRVLEELSHFEEQLKFESLTKAPILPEELETRLKTKALKLEDEYQEELREPLKNIIADIFSVIAFSILIYNGKEQIATLKSFFDEIVYGLSDSAKAFLIILLTDIFVGFHSPHGWEVIMDAGLNHFGLPLNENFINMFIATFPVMLDTVFKYWIFRYLNQISPSAVATYRNMNE